MIGESIHRSLRRKLMFVVLATTFAALLVAALALVVNEMQNYRQSFLADLRTQADIVARASAPALAFNDSQAASDNLALLRAQPRITAAAIYLADGRRFAAYPSGTDRPVSLPAAPSSDGSSVDGGVASVTHPIIENGERLGTVYVQARYELAARLWDYIGIIGVAMAASLVVALSISSWLQASITTPVLDITHVAREVMERRDFSLRVEKTTADEVGYLVDAFNDMLSEVGRRAQALEQSNRELSHEMGERKLAEEALRAADRRKDEFLATLAHELRNPLAPMRNALHILRAANARTADAAEARDIIDRQLRQMVRLVDDLLDVSRISTGKLVLRPERVNLASVLRNAVETARPLIDERHHTLDIETPQTPVWLEADPTRLAQVFANLLNNAAKYTNSGGRIDVRTHREADRVVVLVQDNGIGIEPQMLGAIFSMFAQVDDSLERVHSGLGVGLTLAQRLVELHGGTIEATSPGLGHGSEFRVTLPVATAPADVQPKPSVAPSATRRRVLIVDDNRDFASSLALLLQALGHDVLVAHDGQSAIDRAQGYRPDFVFLDIGLPGMNGYEVAARLRAMPVTRDSVLTAVTGWGQDKDRVRAQQAGFDHHIVKPLDPEDLESLLAQRSARAQ